MAASVKGIAQWAAKGRPYRKEDIMYTYEYERIHVYTGRAQWANSKSETTGHREIIERRAKAGWRYAGFIPVTQSGTGTVMDMDLIFEKEV